VPARRIVLTAGLASLITSSLPLRTFARARTSKQRFAAAWEDAGQHYAGVLAQRADSTPLELLERIVVPTRAHALVPLADGSVLAVARRPGDWLLRFNPSRPRAAQWWWQDGAHVFTGHVLLHHNGKQFFTTETDTATGAGLLVLRDTHSFAVLAQWPTGGIDPHALVWQGRDAILVANGGIATTQQTGRTKLNLERMDASLVRLDARSGALLGQWRLPDQRLSIRHLAWSATTQPLLGIALQAEHEDAQQRQAAPVLATFDGTCLQLAAGSIALQGYGGDIAALPAPQAGWAISCPRAGVVAVFDHAAQLRITLPLPQACALANTQHGVWAAGQGRAMQIATATAAPLSAGWRMDNHWVVLPSTARL
jgi:uncharacterized protein